MSKKRTTTMLAERDKDRDHDIIDGEIVDDAAIEPLLADLTLTEPPAPGLMNTHARARLGLSFDAALAGYRADIEAFKTRIDETFEWLPKPHVEPTAQPVGGKIYDQEKGWVPAEFDRETALAGLVGKSIQRRPTPSTDLVPASTAFSRWQRISQGFRGWLELTR